MENAYVSVNEFFAVYLTVATSVSYFHDEVPAGAGISESTGNIVVLVVITLAAFAAYAGIGYEDFSVARCSNMYAFNALLVALISGGIYYALKESRFLQTKQRTNADNVYYRSGRGNAAGGCDHWLFCIAQTSDLCDVWCIRLTGAVGNLVQFFTKALEKRCGRRTDHNPADA